MWMDKYLGEFMADGFVTPAHSEMVHDLIAELLIKIRPDAVPLVRAHAFRDIICHILTLLQVDAFGFDDFFLNSALGRHDGDVYEVGALLPS